MKYEIIVTDLDVETNIKLQMAAFDAGFTWHTFTSAEHQRLINTHAVSLCFFVNDRKCKSIDALKDWNRDRMYNFSQRLTPDQAMRWLVLTDLKTESAINTGMRAFNDFCEGWG